MATTGKLGWKPGYVFSTGGAFANFRQNWKVLELPDERNFFNVEVQETGLSKHKAYASNCDHWIRRYAYIRINGLKPRSLPNRLNRFKLL